MLLSCSFLTQVADVNNFNESPKVLMTEGDTVDIWLMLKDMSQNPVAAGFNPPGRRYIPPTGSSLQVIVDSIDSARKVVKYATQPFANDPSIWKVQLLPGDRVVGTHTLKLVLNENSKVINGVVASAVYSTPLSVA